MATEQCVRRLQRESRLLRKEPVPNIVARPSKDVLEWHYVLEGSEGTPYAGGFYHGKIKFPPDYPYKPPSIIMITPNGRFMTNKRICLSMSDYHPETWNPMWSVASILTGLLSFMVDDSPTTGSVSSTLEEKRRLAKASLAYNCQNATFRKMFPEYAEKYFELVNAEKKESEVACSKGSPNLNSEADSKQMLAVGHREKESVQKMPTKHGGSRSFPTWIFVLLMAVFGTVMALPLLSLD